MKNRKDTAVTQSDVDKAWERFAESVRGEPVPAVWAEAGNARQTPKQVETGQERQVAATPQPASATAVRTPSRRPRMRRTVWTAAAAAIAGLVVLTPWGVQAAASLLHSFRMQHLESVSIDETAMNKLQQALLNGSTDTQRFEISRYGQVEQLGGGPKRTVTADEARRLADGDLKLPKALGPSPTFAYGPEQRLSFRLHAGEINKLLGILGGKSKLPAAVDGQTIAIDMPAVFGVEYRNAGGIVNLLQLQVPTIDVPEDVDVEEVRKAVLDLPLLPQEVRSKLAGISDWKHTLPVPSIGGSDKQLIIGGNEAVLTAMNGARSLLWLQDGRVYRLYGSTESFPTEESIIAEAKGIMQS